jgi:DNA-binding NarL/FixJ family response regulator
VSFIEQYFEDGDSDEQPYADVDFNQWTFQELQTLSPRRKILVDLERALSEAAGEEIKVPATRKMHKGRNWKKSSPNISNDDLYEIAKGIFKALDASPMIAQTIRPDVLQLTNAEEEIYQVLDSEDRFFSMEEIADEVEKTESTVRDHIYRMREKMDFKEKTEGEDGCSYKKKLKLPPAYRDIKEV